MSKSLKRQVFIKVSNQVWDRVDAPFLIGYKVKAKVWSHFDDNVLILNVSDLKSQIIKQVSDDDLRS